MTQYLVSGSAWTIVCIFSIVTDSRVVCGLMIFVRFGFYYFFEYIFNNLNLMDSIIYRRYDIYLVKVENGPKIK